MKLQIIVAKNEAPYYSLVSETPREKEGLRLLFNSKVSENGLAMAGWSWNEERGTLVFRGAGDIIYINNEILFSEVQLNIDKLENEPVGQEGDQRGQEGHQ